jgi:E3 ubiquitin-protein ligase UBR4
MTYGHVILSIIDLLSQFLGEKNIKNRYKGQLLTTLLDSYLKLKKLLYKRTKYTDDAQNKLLALLEDITCDTVDEKRRFIQICIDQVNKIDMNSDLVTPVFLFERLCNIIHAENLNDQKEFFIILEKDANQEDYLQGRMQGKYCYCWCNLYLTYEILY